MTDTTQILKAIGDMNTTTNVGFEKVHKKIDKKFDQCDERLVDIETELAVKKALCKKKKEDTKEKKDYWQPIIRAVTIAGILSLLSMAFSLLSMAFGVSL